MQVRMYVFSVLFFLGALQFRASDTPSTELISLRDIPIAQILGSDYVPLSLLVKLIGYHKACTYKELSISNTAYALFQSLYISPKDIQQMVLTRLRLFLTDRWHHFYAHGFQKNLLSVPTDSSCIPMIHLLNGNMLAINTHCTEPVKIWSLEKSSAIIFESAHRSKLASCYLEPSNCLVSLNHTGLAFNLLRKDGTDWKDTTTEPIINPNVSIINFIAYNNSIITRNLGNDLDMYDIEVPSHVQSYPHAHTDYISCGIQVSEHLFCTGSYDSTIKLWDARTHNPSATVLLPHDAAPYAVRVFDNNTLLVGMNKKCALRSIDIRKTNILTTIMYDKHPIYDLIMLQNGALALCADCDVDFADITETQSLAITRTIPNLEVPLALTKSPDDTLAIADRKSVVFVLKPTTQPPHIEAFSLSEAFTCVALNTESTE